MFNCLSEFGASHISTSAVSSRHHGSQVTRHLLYSLSENSIASPNLVPEPVSMAASFVLIADSDGSTIAVLSSSSVLHLCFTCNFAPLSMPGHTEDLPALFRTRVFPVFHVAKSDITRPSKLFLWICGMSTSLLLCGGILVQFASPTYSEKV